MHSLKNVLQSVASVTDEEDEFTPLCCSTHLRRGRAVKPITLCFYSFVLIFYLNTTTVRNTVLGDGGGGGSFSRA